MKILKYAQFNESRENRDFKPIEFVQPGHFATIPDREGQFLVISTGLGSDYSVLKQYDELFSFRDKIKAMKPTERFELQLIAIKTDDGYELLEYGKKTCYVK